ncbi:MAG: hypothetical protein WCD11_05005 [Solirubrobacteraceae bacterium]
MGEDEDSQDVRAPRASLLNQVAPQLLAERGTGVLLAAKFIGEIAGISVMLFGERPTPGAMAGGRLRDRRRGGAGGRDLELTASVCYHQHCNLVCGNRASHG